MEQFIKQHAERVIGTLEGWDRLLFRGTLRSLSYVDGLYRFLWHRRILLKDVGTFAESCTQRLADHAQAVAAAAGRPYQYLRSPKLRKEDLARQIAEADGVEQGLICVLSCVEPCRSVGVYRDRACRKLRLVVQTRQCRFFYFYFMHPSFGLMHVRIQSWLPFEVQVCLNGRSYLQRRLDRAGIGYRKADNCFLAVDDPKRAQAMLDDLTRRHWPSTLRRIVAPLVAPLLGRGGALAEAGGYYWTIRQSEYATDVMFADAAALGRVYPALCRHATHQLHSADVLRFLGQKRAGRRQVTSDYQARAEGVRVKHRVGGNSLKIYDKHASVLRVETTINDPQMFRSLRQAQNQPDSPLAWRKMRKSVADIARRATVSRDANHRYLDALSVVHEPETVSRVLDPIHRPVKTAGRSSRALRPLDPQDAALFGAILRGEHLLHGLTNRQVQAALFPNPPRDATERRRRSAYVSRQLRLLRCHGLIRKLGRQRSYRITNKGHRVLSLALLLRDANQTLLRAA